MSLLADDLEWEHDAEGWECRGVPWLRPGRVARFRHLVDTAKFAAATRA